MVKWTQNRFKSRMRLPRCKNHRSKICQTRGQIRWSQSMAQNMKSCSRATKIYKLSLTRWRNYKMSNTRSFLLSTKSSWSSKSSETSSSLSISKMLSTASTQTTQITQIPSLIRTWTPPLPTSHSLVKKVTTTTHWSYSNLNRDFKNSLPNNQRSS